jgi:anti-sigma factor RsiW
MKLTSHRLVCRDAVELMSDYVDGALPRRQRKRLERHLAACDACSGYLEQLRATISASGSASPDDLDPEVLDGLVDLYEKYRDGDVEP